ncbi:VPA1267 family protein [Rhizobacter sp. Root404]|uniref:VPA1267 family protein n=1 Tax=Rhizobacter sp. Root404 TaxID=1736528 RepID=UPI0006F51709|nr:VPA1267 family protein [Rhizobacter sp. Root404]
MANGQQVAEENVRRFTTWVASKTDDDFRSLVSRGVLSRTDIAAECGFAKSVLSQNPRVRVTLKELEVVLRERGVLPKLAIDATGTPLEVRTRQAEGVGGARDAERLKRLEQENASLRAELVEVKRALSRYALLQEALAETGRLPR